MIRGYVQRNTKGMENYHSAALRHYNDAEILRDVDRLDNAGHLIGFAAECAIKHRIRTLPTSTNSPHGHFPDLLTIARKHLGARGNYTGMYELIKQDILIAWNVNRRYRETGHTTRPEIDEWFACAKRLLASAQIRERK